MIRDASALNYNEWQAVAIAQNLWRQLKKTGHLDAYNAEIQDYLDMGVISPVSRKNIAEWQRKGHPVCFIIHHPVLHPDKAITKVHLISNSSLSIGGEGNSSPNDHWPKGP